MSFVFTYPFGSNASPAVVNTRRHLINKQPRIKRGFLFSGTLFNLPTGFTLGELL